MKHETSKQKCFVFLSMEKMLIRQLNSIEKSISYNFRVQKIAFASFINFFDKKYGKKLVTNSRMWQKILLSKFIAWKNAYFALFVQYIQSMKWRF